MQETQSGNFMNSKKVNVDFCLLEFSATKNVMWKFHVDEYKIGRYGMILGRDLLNSLGLDLKFFENITIGGKGPYEG